MSKSKSVEPARHSSSTAKIHRYICQNQSPLSQLDIPAQRSAQQLKYIYIYMSKSKSVEPARHSSSTVSSTVTILDPCTFSQLNIPAQPAVQ